MALYAWGENNCGQLGINSTIRASTPVLIPGNWILVVRGLFGMFMDEL